MERIKKKKTIFKKRSFGSHNAQQQGRKRGSNNRNKNNRNGYGAHSNQKSAVLIMPNRAKRFLSKGRTTFPDGSLPDIKRPSLTPEALAEKQSQDIPNVYTDIFDDRNQSVVSFDEAIEQVKRMESLAEDETIIYGGAGNFVVIGIEESDPAEEEDDDRRGGRDRDTRLVKQIVRRKIEFEQKNKEPNWRAELRYGLSAPYEPNPDPMTSLYTNEEIANFELNK